MATGKYTFLDYAEEVLQKTAKPMTFYEIWEEGKNLGFETFIDDVQRDYAGKKIHASEYEGIINDPELYIKKIRSEKS